MSFDLEDFKKTIEKKRAEKLGGERIQLQAIRQAALNADAVTGDPAWDVFLTYLQKAIDDNTMARDALLRDLANPTLVNPDLIAGKRIALIQRNERLIVLSHVIAMPAQIKKLGAVADERLKALSAPDDETPAA